MVDARSIADALAVLDQAAIEARLATLGTIALTPQPSGKMLGGPPRLTSGASNPIAPDYNYLNQSGLTQFQVMGGLKRGVAERFADFGAVYSNHKSLSAPSAGYATVKRCLAKHPRVLLDQAAILMDTRLLATDLNGSILDTMTTVSGGGVATFVFIDPASAMLTGVSGSRDIRFAGAHHWHYRERSTGANFAFDLRNVKNFYGGAMLAITNANNGMRIGAGSEGIYIPHLHIEADVALQVDLGCAGVRVGRITGTGTITVAAGADCVIGCDNVGLLAGLGGLTPAASKIIYYDANGVPSLMDWIIGGSFVPTVSCATPGNLSVSYSTANGSVNKRGRDVEVSFTLVFTPTYTTASGNFQIGGLPFVADGNTALSLLNISSMSGFTWPGSATQLFIAVTANQNSATLIGHRSGAGTQTAAITTFPTDVAQTLRVTGKYRGTT